MSSHVAPSNVDPHEPVVAHPRSSQSRTRISGLLLAAGAVAWSVGTVIVGDRVQEGVQTLDTVTGMVFVAGLLAFVWTVHVTRSASSACSPSGSPSRSGAACGERSAGCPCSPACGSR
ncbi:hypothetical protein ACWEPN_43920 [Nonomuraea wenchangensis]